MGDKSERTTVPLSVWNNLGPTTIEFAAKSFDLDLVELWSDQGSRDTLECRYVYSSDPEIANTTLAIGHVVAVNFHTVSPDMCAEAAKSEDSRLWCNEIKTVKSESFGTQIVVFYEDDSTESSSPTRLYMVIFLRRELEYSKAMMAFLHGLLSSVYVAVNHANVTYDSDNSQDDDLDLSEHNIDRVLIKTPPKHNGRGGLNNNTTPITTANLASLSAECTTTTEGTTPQPSSRDSPRCDNDSDAKTSKEQDDEEEGILTKAPGGRTLTRIDSQVSLSSGMSDSSLHIVSSYGSGSSYGSHFSTPDWEPLQPFSFPIYKMPILTDVLLNLTLSSFTDVSALAEGSNAQIFKVRFDFKPVIVKIMKREVRNMDVAAHEFDIEHALLSRCDHENIVKIVGAGCNPRKFLLLECLEGGTLADDLAKPEPPALSRLFGRNKEGLDTEMRALKRARDLAVALRYLHNVFPGACIIHRDLKPDNIGFTSDGKLKLFDFGLATCVNQRQRKEEAYLMTGNTGSLRYMAPEVELRLPYTEKVDVYSFSIIMWQMLKRKVPFKGYSKDKFVELVIKKNMRPLVPKHWPTDVKNLLEKCWDRDPDVRPDMNAVVAALDAIILPKKSSSEVKQKNGLGARLNSSWF